VYVTEAFTVSVATAGWLPNPLPSPVTVTDVVPLNVTVGPECHVTAAKAMVAVMASAIPAAAVERTNRRMIGLLPISIARAASEGG
jgi:hypothetical protein